MLWKPIFILSLTAFIFDVQTPHLKTSAERQNDPASLPHELTESETQTILKERSTKPHVESALKVSDTRINSALELVKAEQYKPAAENVRIYAALIIYADAFARKLPGSQNKDRNYCLKKIEQIIFKQTRTVEAVMREMPVAVRESAEENINQVKKIRLRAVNDLLGSGQVINPSN